MEARARESKQTWKWCGLRKGALERQEEWWDMYEKGSAGEKVSGHRSDAGLEITCMLEGRMGRVGGMAGGVVWA